MFDIIKTNELSVTKIKTLAKTMIENVIADILRTEYGVENVAKVRSGSENSRTNLFAAKVGTVNGVFDCETLKVSNAELCVTINVTAKEYTIRKTTKRVYPAFDFKKAREEYRTYMIDKNSK